MFTRFRKTSGQSLVELAAGLIVLLPIVFVMLDLAVCAIAITTNDTASRDAARAAAAGRPTTNTFGREDASNRAKAVVNRVYQGGGYIKGPTLVGNFGVNDPDSGPQQLSQPTAPVGGPYGGTYRVTTQIVVKIPASIPLVIPETYTFHSRQEFPITKLEANKTVPL